MTTEDDNQAAAAANCDPNTTNVDCNAAIESLTAQASKDATIRSSTPPPQVHTPSISPSREIFQKDPTTPLPDGDVPITRIHSSPGFIDASPNVSPEGDNTHGTGVVLQASSGAQNQQFSRPAFPMRPRAKMPPGHELTPVIRNTTSDEDDLVFHAAAMPGLGFIVVSPEDEVEDGDGAEQHNTTAVQQLQRRVHRRPAPQAAPTSDSEAYDDSLALPHSRDLSADNDGDGHGASSAVPYLPKNSIDRNGNGGMMAVRQRMPVSHPSDGVDDNNNNNGTDSKTEGQDANGTATATNVHDDDEDTFGDLSPIKITSDRKFYSFNGRSQYRRALAEASVTRGVSGVDPSMVVFDAMLAENNMNGDAANSNGEGSPNQRKQYQPSRELSLTEIGVGATMKKEELATIFNTSRAAPNSSSAATTNNNNLRHQNFISSQQNGYDGSSSYNAFPLVVDRNGATTTTIPLDERDLSIPSIRLANHLTNVSTNSYATNSYTCSEEDDLEDPAEVVDDDDDVTYEDDTLDSAADRVGAFRQNLYDDDATLSSQGSAVVVLSNGDGVTAFVGDVEQNNEDESGQSLQQQQKQHQEKEHNNPAILIAEGMDKVSIHAGTPDDASDTVAAVALSTCASAPHLASAPAPGVRGHIRHGSTGSYGNRSKSKKSKKEEEERKAFEWLRTVEVGRENEFLAEAASSKFLTGGVRPAHPLLSSSGAPVASTAAIGGMAAPNGTAPRSTLSQPLAPIKLNRVLTSPPTLAQGKNPLVSGAAVVPPKTSNVTTANVTYQETVPAASTTSVDASPP